MLTINEQTEKVKTCIDNLIKELQKQIEKSFIDPELISGILSTRLSYINEIKENKD